MDSRKEFVEKLYCAVRLGGTQGFMQSFLYSSHALQQADFSIVFADSASLLAWELISLEKKLRYIALSIIFPFKFND